jgi:hypothetical protein
MFRSENISFCGNTSHLESTFCSENTDYFEKNVGFWDHVFRSETNFILGLRVWFWDNKFQFENMCFVLRQVSIWEHVFRSETTSFNLRTRVSFWDPKFQFENTCFVLRLQVSIWEHIFPFTKFSNYEVLSLRWTRRELHSAYYKNRPSCFTEQYLVVYWHGGQLCSLFTGHPVSVFPGECPTTIVKYLRQTMALSASGILHKYNKCNQIHTKLTSLPKHRRREEKRREETRQWYETSKQQHKHLKNACEISSFARSLINFTITFVINRQSILYTSFENVR